MKARYDAIIIGAGVIGCCVAFEMAKRGLKTLNIDKLPAAGYGSTSFSCAIIRTHYSTFEGTALAYEASFKWRDWEGYLETSDERGLAQFTQTGCLIMETAADRHARKMLVHADKLAIAWEEWSVKDVMRKLPFLDLTCYGPPKRYEDAEFAEPSGGSVTGAIYFPQVGHMSDPQLAAHNAQCAAQARGAEFRFNTEVITIRQSAGRVCGIITAAGEDIDAPVVINIAGPHSAKINAMAGVDGEMALSTGAARQELAHVPAVPEFDFEHDGTLLFDGDAGSYARQEIGNKMIVGSINPACDGTQWVDPDDYNTSITDQASLQVMRLAQRMPTLGIPGQLHGAAALYDVSDDWIPIYDKSSLPGFYMAVGTSGNQFKNAPIAGAMMAELVMACEGGQDHDQDPVSFKLEQIGEEISIGFFSRNRKIKSESSFSVLG